jgi:protein CpxP
MKKFRTPLIAVTLIAALAGQVFAKEGHGHEGPMSEKMMQRMAERHNKHLGELRTKLKLDAGQETAWKQFSDSMQPPAKPPVMPDRATLEKLTTPERIDQMQALHAQREAEMKKHADATKTFYASLSAEQKKVFDQETVRFMGTAGHPMRRHHGH